MCLILLLRIAAMNIAIMKNKKHEPETKLINKLLNLHILFGTK
jgi:hypothetical protein